MGPHLPEPLCPTLPFGCPVLAEARLGGAAERGPWHRGGDWAAPHVFHRGSASGRVSNGAQQQRSLTTGPSLGIRCQGPSHELLRPAGQGRARPVRMKGLRRPASGSADRHKEPTVTAPRHEQQAGPSLRGRSAPPLPPAVHCLGRASDSTRRRHGEGGTGEASDADRVQGKGGTRQWGRAVKHTGPRGTAPPAPLEAVAAGGAGGGPDRAVPTAPGGGRAAPARPRPSVPALPTRPPTLRGSGSVVLGAARERRRQGDLSRRE